jgi:hypothetical protein
VVEVPEAMLLDVVADGGERDGATLRPKLAAGGGT